MKRLALIASLAGYVLLAPTFAIAQSATGPRWESRDADKGIRQLSGTVMFRVSKDATNVKRAEGVRFAIRVTRTNETFVCDKLPYSFAWDTTKVAEGWHWLGVVMIDPNGEGSEKVIDSLKVYVRNKRETPLPVLVPVEPVVSGQGTGDSASRSTVARTESASLPTNATSSAKPRTTRPLASRRRVRTRAPRVLSLPETVSIEVVSASVGVSNAPLSVPRVSALYKQDRFVYLGLPDGGVAVWDEEEKRGSVARVAGIAGPVRALAASRDTLYWTAGASDKVYAYQLKDKTVKVFDAGERFEESVGSEDGKRDEAAVAPSLSTGSDSDPWIERLAVLGKRVVLMGASATRIWDGESGLKPLADLLPADVAQTYSDALVQCYVGSSATTREALLVFATPNSSGGGGSLHLWSGNAESLRGGWRDRGTLATGKDFFGINTPEMALTPFGMLVPEKVEGFGRVSGLQFATWNDNKEPVTPQNISLGVTGDYNANAPQSAETVSVGASGVWWAQNGVVFHADPFNATRECYMPWNGAGGMVTALLADKEGAYVATDKGVQRVVLGQPNESDGYGGYVRVPLGEEYAYPKSDREQKLLAGIDEWQGVPYRWGGQTKAGADCSGFVGAVHRSLGVNLPRTSKQMGETRMGTRVRDELRYGDTLVFPGHVALYIGNGRTGETVGGSSTSTNGSVSKSTIWRRRDVIVKRFLP